MPTPRLPVSFHDTSLYTHGRAHTGPSIRQLSSIEAVRHRKVASDLAVKSRLRAAHDTLNPWLVDPETFNLDVTACCQEEISLYSSYVRAPRSHRRIKTSLPLLSYAGNLLWTILFSPFSKGYIILPEIFVTSRKSRRGQIDPNHDLEAILELSKAAKENITRRFYTLPRVSFISFEVNTEGLVQRRETRRVPLAPPTCSFRCVYSMITNYRTNLCSHTL